MIESGPVAGLVGSKRLGELIGGAEHHRRRHGRHDVQGRRHPAGADRVPARVDGAALPLRAPEDRRRLARPRRREHRLARPEDRDPAHRPAERRLLPGTRLLRPRRARADDHGRRRDPRLPEPGVLPRAGASSSTSARRTERSSELVAGPLGMDVIEAAAAMYRLANSPLLRPAAPNHRAAGSRSAPLRALLLRRHGRHARVRLRRAPSACPRS